MALMLSATHRLAGNDSNGRTAMARYDILCYHTIVGYAPAAAAHFSTHANGKVTQDRDTKYRGAANLDGNHRILSVETEDHGAAFAGYWKHASDVPPWTPEQCESNARIAAWAHKTHGIPLVLAPNSRPTSRGIGYHRQGCDGNFGAMAYGGRVSGGEKWSNAFGKVCPGDRRIKQLIEIVIPRARVLAGLDQEEDDMQLTDKLPPVKLADGSMYTLTVGDVLYGMAQYIGGNGGTLRPPLTAHPMGQYVSRVLAIAGIEAKVDALAGALSDDEANIISALRSRGDGLTAEQQAAVIKTQLDGSVLRALRTLLTEDQEV